MREKEEQAQFPSDAAIVWKGYIAQQGETEA